MDTQNTPIHIKLWHRDFWLLAFANLFLMMSVYAQIPGLPPYLLERHFTPLEVASSMGVFGLGIFALGGFCSYWVQRYRRNRVCQWAMVGVALCSAVLFYIDHFLQVKVEFWMVLALRFVMGACLGLAQMTLSSTLIIDTCESFQRTEANYISAWFSRYALALAPVVVAFSFDYLEFKYSLVFSVVTALVAFVLVSVAKFPFKAPTDHMPLFSLDRFFLPQGLPLFVNIVLVMSAVGILLGSPHSSQFYLLIGAGLTIGFLAEKYVFADADLKSEVITGLLLMGAAILILTSDQLTAIEFISPALMGFAVGIMGSRFLLFYIKLAKHCQRGTSMSSFFLAWELGLSLGLFLGFMLLEKQNPSSLAVNFPLLNRVDGHLIVASLVLVVVSLILYNFFVHPWYMKHRNR